jgi:hypothetical protein
MKYGNQKLHCATNHAHKIIHTIQTEHVFIMTVDDTNKFAQAELLLDNDHFDSDAVDSSLVAPAAQPVVTTYSTSKTDPAMANDQNSSTPSSGPQGTDQDADMVSHNVQHKKNVVIGVASGVLLGAVLLGPIGAVAGGFGGRAIVRRRERRWCQRQSSVGETTTGEAQEEECVVVDVIAAGNDTTTTAGPAFLVVTE